MQDVQVARYGTEQRRESFVLHHLQFVWFPKIGHSYQDWLFGTSRKEKEAANVRVGFALRLCVRCMTDFWGRHAHCSVRKSVNINHNRMTPFHKNVSFLHIAFQVPCDGMNTALRRRAWYDHGVNAVNFLERLDPKATSNSLEHMQLT